MPPLWKWKKAKIPKMEKIHTLFIILQQRKLTFEIIFAFVLGYSTIFKANLKGFIQN